MTEVSVNTSIRNWSQRFQGQLTQLYLFTAAQMQTNRGMLFIHSGAYNGHETWAPLKLRDGQPLRDRGTLMKSIGPIVRAKTGRVVPVRNEGTIIRYGGDVVTIGTSLKKARILNDGGVIVPVKAKLLWIPLPANRKSQNEAVKKAISDHRKGKGRAESLGGAPIVRLRNGKYFMLAKKVVIPPRPFDKLNAQDRNEIQTALAEEVARCLNQEK